MSGLDDEIERLLRQYRVSDPPAGLRDQIVALAFRPAARRSIVDWLPAAAAVIIATLFYWLAGVERQHLEARISPLPPVDQTAAHAQEPQP